ncbi:TetR/AcrR family transcriptional regulator [Sphingobium sp. HBC34]|uniref:TetR/AcrR family transcriptional regulator n=1 Tax=Sphingobium cyanobacteriorum TaxID=3063954 RepID=A0ABT8ZP21_9SPHN|nr:TetR/AcrR family transcriptional regulator [Sphingobium sp. HBC34]MDO7836277.1 TetR/AcrR family transcriptional regulator [Sphingobium sp. HBC34]
MARPREFDEEHVLEAVMERFWTAGFERTSAQDLVDATGLGRGSLYAAYASKEGLFEQALLRYRKRARAHVDKLDAEPSAIKALRILMTDVVDADLPRPHPRGCLATNSAIEMAAHNPRIAELVRENFGILRRGIEGTMRRGQATGELSSNRDAAALAMFVFTAIQGLRVMARALKADDRQSLFSVIEQTLLALR